MPLTLAGGSQVKLYQSVAGPLYESVLNILGTEGIIFLICDSLLSFPGTTTFTTAGTIQDTFNGAIDV